MRDSLIKLILSENSSDDIWEIHCKTIEELTDEELLDIAKPIIANRTAEAEYDALTEVERRTSFVRMYEDILAESDMDDLLRVAKMYGVVNDDEEDSE